MGGVGLLAVTLGLLTPVLAEEGAGARAATHTLATAPLAIPGFGVMECTLVNLHGEAVAFKLRQHQHFRPAFDPFVIEKTQSLGAGQSTTLAATVGSDPAIGRCTFEFQGDSGRVRAAAVVLEAAVIEAVNLDFSVVLADGKAVAAAEAR
jgi:hypothetical protein